MQFARAFAVSLLGMALTLVAIAQNQIKTQVVGKGKPTGDIRLRLEASNTAPTTTDEYALTITLEPAATVTTPAIVRVALYEDAIFLADSKVPPYVKFQLPTHTSGTYTYFAEAYDERGTKCGISNEVTLTVKLPDVDSGTATKPATDDWNGIGVGRAKMFDDRALGLMLRDVEAALSGGRFIDPTALGTAIGRFQGATASQTAFSLSASTLPTMALDQTTTQQVVSTVPTSTSVVSTATSGSTTTQTDASGTQTSTSNVVDKVTQPSATAATVTMPGQSSIFSFTPTFGVSAGDLLAEQTELTYQAINLRLLLQRAISDKALIEPTAATPRVDPRLQVVLGFQISVDPPSGFRYRGAAAEVVIKIASEPDRNRRPDPPSLVSLLPREKTYNVATVKKGSSALNVGAVAQPINVGLGISHSRESLYLVKDTDTVALERTASNGKGVEFAWQFRPVLGQKSVTPGSRQVFAVLSLPAGVTEDWIGRVQVTTRWRHYNARRRVMGGVFDETIVAHDPYELKIDSVRNQARAVTPHTDLVLWNDAGNNNIVVTLEGRFPTGTRVAAGDRILQNSASGLVLDSQRRLTFVIPAQTLFLGDVALVDSFGETERIIYKRADLSKARQGDLTNEKGYEIFRAVAEPAGVDKMDVSVCIAPGLDLNAAHQPLFRIGQTVFGVGESPVLYTAVNPEANTIDSYVKSLTPVWVETLTPAGTTNRIVHLRAKGDYPVRVETAFAEEHAKDVKRAKEVCGIKEYEEIKGEVLLASFKAPTAVVTAARAIQVIDPFWGELYNRTEKIVFPDREKSAIVSDLKILALDDQNALLGITGENFDKETITLSVGKEENVVPKMRSPSLLVFEIGRDKLASLRQIIVETKPSGATTGKTRVTLLKIPNFELRHPRLIRYSPIEQGRAGTIRIDGVHLDAVREIRFSSTPLKITPADNDSTVIYVELDDSVVSVPGEKALTVTAADGSVQTLLILVRQKG